MAGEGGRDNLVRDGAVLDIVRFVSSRGVACIVLCYHITAFANCIMYDQTSVILVMTRTESEISILAAVLSRGQTQVRPIALTFWSSSISRVHVIQCYAVKPTQSVQCTIAMPRIVLFRTRRSRSGRSQQITSSFCRIFSQLHKQRQRTLTQ